MASRSKFFRQTVHNRQDAKFKLHGVEKPPIQEQYDHICHELLSKLQSGTQSSADKEDREGSDEPFLDGITLGKYAHAVHHSDGIFSTVYKARPAPPSGANVGPKYVALKVTVPGVMSPPHDSVREARILTEAASPHVISLLETFRLPGGKFIMVFPFMPLDLEQLLKGERLTTPQLKSHLTDLFRALEHLHTIGIIHRDIKPSNILLASESGPARLADFGIAWSPNDNASEPPLCKITDVGTTSYRPPELLFGFAGYSSALDMWAAGCVVAEALTVKNEPLFDAGPLGSELALISSIFRSLGTPNLENWPEAAIFPDWGKIEFHRFPARGWEQLLPTAQAEARDLALAHPFLNPTIAIE
ncbi:hypothetical protein GP486_004833 [Trichoglossum hirsutum]|uniref:cyclin-dependent kinase n=1 Tax=Trichoglossum hirsutum TaxID=265104 RepID=A0A9P8LAF3_9PEZI|nr:hypothetical protein GP486_004833 [Trichoglossum hirsutum]